MCLPRLREDCERRKLRRGRFKRDNDDICFCYVLHCARHAPRGPLRNTFVGFEDKHASCAGSPDVGKPGEISCARVSCGRTDEGEANVGRGMPPTQLYGKSTRKRHASFTCDAKPANLTQGDGHWRDDG